MKQSTLRNVPMRANYTGKKAIVVGACTSGNSPLRGTGSIFSDDAG